MKNRPKAVLVSIIAILLVWLVVQFTFFNILGVSFGGDSDRYISGAQALIHHNELSPKAYAYLGYILFVVPFLILPWGLGGVVAGQLVLSVLAIWAVYYLGKTMYSRRAGWLAAGGYVLFLKLHPWNFFILTDSFFISTAFIGLAFLVLVQTKKRSIYDSLNNKVIRILMWFAVIFILAMAISSRPDGLALLMSVAIYILYRLWRVNFFMVLAATLGLFLIIVPVIYLLSENVIAHTYLVDEYAKGAVIWNYPPLYLSLPDNISSQIKPGNNPIINIILFAIDKPLFLSQLIGAKLFYFFAHVRPFNNVFHNVAIIITLYPLYGLAWASVLRKNSRPDIKILLVTLILIKAIIAAFTFADWSGRFLLHIIPAIIVLASGEVDHFMARNASLFPLKPWFKLIKRM
jgi:hypothetical protein